MDTLYGNFLGSSKARNNNVKNAYDTCTNTTFQLPDCYTKTHEPIIRDIWTLLDESKCCIVCDALIMWFDPKVDGFSVCWSCVEEHNDQVLYQNEQGGHGIEWVPDTSATADLFPITLEWSSMLPDNNDIWTPEDISEWMKILNSETPRATLAMGA